MKFDYSKTINEQLPTFDYYKDRYCSYELELINDRKEIERLNGALQTHEILLKSNVLEIESLNNIIKELEKYLIEEIEHYEKQIKYYKNNKDLRSGILDLVGEYEGEKVCFEDMLGKLQELKGSDSNE